MKPQRFQPFSFSKVAGCRKPRPFITMLVFVSSAMYGLGQSQTDLALPVSSLAWQTASYQAPGSITNSGSFIISNEANVTFTAGSSIRLEAGFDAVAGTASTTFHAKIDSTVQSVSSIAAISGNGSALTFRILNKQSGKVLDVTGASTAENALIQQYDWLGYPNQQWQLVPVGPHYKIVNLKSGYVLDVTGASTADGAPIQQYHWVSGLNQQWDLVPVSGSEPYYEIVNLNSNKVLDVTGQFTASGATIQQDQGSSSPSASQQWQLVPLAPAANSTGKDTGPGTSPAPAASSLFNKDYIYLHGQVVAIQH